MKFFWRDTVLISTCALRTTSICVNFEYLCFANIIFFFFLGKLTDVFEGSIVRVIRRLEELLRQLATAATAIGNNELKKLFEDGAAKIRRGVVFAASLYL